MDSPNPYDDVVDSTPSSSSDHAGGDDGNPTLVDGPSKSTASEAGTEGEGNNHTESESVPATGISPDEALNVIKNQQSHTLYCPRCTTNITKVAKLYPNNQEPDRYRTRHYYLVAAVLLLLSVIVLRSSPGPPSPSPWGGTDTPSPPPGPPSPSPQPGPPSPLPQPGPHLYEKILWIIYFPSIKYLSVSSLLFLAILALFWSSILHIIGNLIAEMKRWSVRDITRLINNIVKQIPTPFRGANHAKVSPPNPVNDTPPTSGPVDAISPAPGSVPTLDPDVILLTFLSKPLDSLFIILHSCFAEGGITPSTSVHNSKTTEISPGPEKNNKGVGLVELYSGSMGARHLEEYCVRRSGRVNHKSRCRIFRCRFRSFNSQRYRFGSSQFIQWPFSHGLQYKGHYKAAVVLVASLVCVVLLSFGKACAFNLSRFWTVVDYSGMAIGASALSFIFSHFLGDVCEKLGLNELADDYRKV
ncbi:hypothetical protein CARUB_v10006810mg [Capsella rubella]|uniref:Uncharacterized protein n=1 Tax=Capsella rubella TaxID=81985 RepID=R0F8M7_9BRAS|nr:hypothetical protein CARUB_v10006810mg [Capsella rubella]